MVVVVDVVEHTGTAEAAMTSAIRGNCTHDRMCSDPLSPEMEELEQHSHNSDGVLEARDVRVQSPGPGEEGDREDQNWMGQIEKVAELGMAAAAVAAVAVVAVAIVAVAVVAVAVVAMAVVAAVVVGGAAIAGDAIAVAGLAADALLLGSTAEPVLDAETNAFVEMASGKESVGVACFDFASPHQTCYEVS